MCFGIAPEPISIIGNDLFARKTSTRRSSRPATPRPQSIRNWSRNNSVASAIAGTPSEPDRERMGDMYAIGVLKGKHIRKTIAGNEIDYSEISMDFINNRFIEATENVPNISIVIDMSMDDFPVFGRTHHSDTAYYLSVHNFNHKLREQLRNRHLIEFGPNGANKIDVMIRMMADFKRLAKRALMEVRRTVRRVYTKVLFVVSDMKEANTIAGMKNPTADVLCKSCITPCSEFGAEDLKRTTYERARRARQMHITEKD